MFVWSLLAKRRMPLKSPEKARQPDRVDLAVATIRGWTENGIIELRILAHLDVVRFHEVRAASLAAAAEPIASDPEVTPGPAAGP
jgi:hypothetical protein